MKASSPICLVLAVLATLGGSGCTGPRASFVSVTEPVTETGIIFVIDGAGNFQGCSQHVRDAIEEDHLPLQVVTFEWSHGYGRILADQVGYAYARGRGCELAERIRQFKLHHPGIAIHIIAHSAGSAPAIAALESLPPRTVDTVCLLAPSMSAAYDIRPALCAVRRSFDVFYSRRDVAYLGVWTGILGNSDRRWGASSGRIGFQVTGDAEILCKVRQRPWQPPDRMLGNDGRHYGDYQVGFLRAYVLPIMR